MRELLRRLHYLLHRDSYEADLSEEMAHHLAMLEQDRPSATAARKQFGNVTYLKEESRNMWTFRFLEQTAQDLRYAVRGMAANKLFTLAAIISLALGIGANTAIYSFMDAIILRSLPVQQPDNLAVLKWHAPGWPKVIAHANGTVNRYGKDGSLSPNFPYGFFESIRSHNSAFTALFSYTYVQNFNALVNGRPETAAGGFVSGNYFSGLGVPPAAGRLIAPDDDRAGAPNIAVITYPYWVERFNSDPSVAGKSLLLNNTAFTIIGVTAPGFYGVDPEGAPKVFLPIHTIPAISPDPVDENRQRFFDDRFYWVEMMGRLRPGVRMEQAEAELRTKFTAFAANTAPTAQAREGLPELFLDPGRAGLDSLRRAYSSAIFVLMAMVGLILAIACANLTNLLLARAAARRREMAVRLSLGAGRARIVRQMLTESLLLSLTGGVLGIAVAVAGVRLITALLANGRENFTLRATVDWPVLAFTFALAAAAGVIFGLAPALQATKVDFTAGLREARTHGTESRWRGVTLRHFLIASQIAISMLLVLTAGLFLRTLVKLHSIDVGFNRENVLLVAVNGRQGGYRGQDLARFYEELLRKFRELPGVRAASASQFPLVSHFLNTEGVHIAGSDKPDRDSDALAVDPQFFTTMQIPLLAGRDLRREDLATPGVAVVNEKFARQFFGAESPLGRRFTIGKNAAAETFEIVGVARNAHYNSLQEKDDPVFYVPYTHSLSRLGRLFFELRAAGDPTGLTGSVRRIVHDASPTVAITEVSTQVQRIEQTISQERTFATLGGCFAGLALLIACVGLYGAMSYMVARRTSEIGIRMALGAARGGIVWMVLRQVIVLAAIGLAAGYGAARLTAHLITTFLYGVKPNDSVTTAVAAGILLSAALIAGYSPAWRAACIDPSRALRNE